MPQQHMQMYPPLMPPHPMSMNAQWAAHCAAQQSLFFLIIFIASICRCTRFVHERFAWIEYTARLLRRSGTTTATDGKASEYVIFDCFIICSSVDYVPRSNGIRFDQDYDWEKANEAFKLELQKCKCACVIFIICFSGCYG